MTVRESGRDAVMINCNPETVSTDYDTSDRLYFEPLTLEDVLGVVEVEQPEGVIVQFGGQTPLKLAPAWSEAGVHAAGHERRRDRPRRGPRPLRRAAGRAGLRRAAVCDGHVRRGGARARARRSATRCWCARPTCSAAARWRSSTTADGLRDYLQRRRARPAGEIFLDRFLENAIEVDVDALCDGEDVWIGGDHAARRGGRHPLGRQRLRAAAALAGRRHARRRSAQQTRGIALGLGVVGLINIQYAIHGGASCT